MVGMPMPSTRQVTMVSSSETNRLSLPMAMMAPMKVEAMPVSVSVPMTMPTMAQAMPTGSAFFAPSARESMQMTSVSRPPLKNRQAATSAPSTSTNMSTPYFMKEAAARPSAIQNTMRKANGPMSAASGVPRMSTMVSARPIVPAK